MAEKEGRQVTNPQLLHYKLKCTRRIRYQVRTCYGIFPSAITSQREAPAGGLSFPFVASPAPPWTPVDIAGRAPQTWSRMARHAALTMTTSSHALVTVASHKDRITQRGCRARLFRKQCARAIRLRQRRQAQARQMHATVCLTRCVSAQPPRAPAILDKSICCNSRSAERVVRPLNAVRRRFHRVALHMALLGRGRARRR